MAELVADLRAVAADVRVLLVGAVARDLLLRLPEGRRRFRLIGVATSGLEPAGAEQVALVRSGSWNEAERALDRVERRFGKGAALPAALLRRPEDRPPGT